MVLGLRPKRELKFKIPRSLVASKPEQGKFTEEFSLCFVKTISSHLGQ